MKAIVREKYGDTQELQLRDIDRPTPKADEVLVKVHAVSLNASDVENMKGSPAYIRAWGLFSPKYKILGSDIAGEIESVGKDVKSFQPGDAVFGDALYSWGGFAEYACVPEKVLTKKPGFLSFEMASTLPQAAVVAEQGIRYKNKNKANNKVLINGAGGGAGSFAVQMAKLYDMEVTAVDSEEKLDMVSSLGADYCIDYNQEDFTKNGVQYDLILDLVASHPIMNYNRSLSENGVYGMVGGYVRHIFQTMFIGGLVSITSSKKMAIIGVKPNEKLKYITKLVGTKQISPVIDKIYSLEDVPEAMQYLANGRVKGKAVIKII